MHALSVTDTHTHLCTANKLPGLRLPRLDVPIYSHVHQPCQSSPRPPALAVASSIGSHRIAEQEKVTRPRGQNNKRKKKHRHTNDTHTYARSMAPFRTVLGPLQTAMAAASSRPLRCPIPAANPRDRMSPVAALSSLSPSLGLGAWCGCVSLSSLSHLFFL